MKQIKAIIQPFMLDAVIDAQAETVRELICQNARTGKPGDGLVIVESVERVVRIRDAL